MNIQSDKAARYSMTLGISSIFAAVFFSFINSVLPIGSFGIILGIAGIAFALISREDGKFPSLARTGLITAVIGIFISIVLFSMILITLKVSKMPEYSAIYNKFFNEALNGETPDIEEFKNELYKTETTETAH